MQSPSRRLSAQVRPISQEEKTVLLERPVPSELANVDAAVLEKTRLRQEALRRLEPVSDERRRQEQLPGICEALRTLCHMNKKYCWPLDILAMKLLPSAGRRGVVEEVRGLLEMLQTQTKGWVVVYENTHADGGTFVKVLKKGFPEALAAVTNSPAAMTKRKKE
jgi:hypothetical protein